MQPDLQLKEKNIYYRCLRIGCEENTWSSEGDVTGGWRKLRVEKLCLSLVLLNEGLYIMTIKQINRDTIRI